VEIATKPVEGALNALVPVVMDGGHQLVQQRRRRREVEPPLEHDHSVRESPWCATGAGEMLVTYGP
jgi:hypothetical protein